MATQYPIYVDPVSKTSDKYQFNRSLYEAVAASSEFPPAIKQVAASILTHYSGKQVDVKDHSFCLTQLDKLLTEFMKGNNPARVNAEGATDKKIEQSAPAVLQQTTTSVTTPAIQTSVKEDGKNPLLVKAKELLKQVKPLADYFVKEYAVLDEKLNGIKTTKKDLHASISIQSVQKQDEAYLKEHKLKIEHWQNLAESLKSAIIQTQKVVEDLDKKISTPQAPVSDKSQLSLIHQFNQDYLRAKKLCDQMTSTLLLGHVHADAVQWKLKEIEFFDSKTPLITQLGIDVEEVIIKVEGYKKISEQKEHVKNEFKKEVYPKYKELFTSTKNLSKNIEWIKNEIAAHDPQKATEGLLKDIVIYDSNLKTRLPEEVTSILTTMNIQRKNSLETVKSTWDTIAFKMSAQLPANDGRTIFVTVQKALVYEINRLKQSVEEFNGVLPKDTTRDTKVGWTYKAYVLSPFDSEQPFAEITDIAQSSISSSTPQAGATANSKDKEKEQTTEKDKDKNKNN